MTIINISTYILSMSIGIFLGMLYMRYLSSFVFFKFEKAFEEQISLYQKFSKEFLDKQLNAHEIQSQKLIKNQNIINQNIDTTNNSIIDLFHDVKEMHNTLDQVNQLENEIIKLKKIIKRKKEK